MKRIFPVLLLLLMVTAGCASSKPDQAAVDPATQPQVHDHYGKVVRVNEADGYVVLECTFLPSAGEEITLFRDRERKIRSRVRVGSTSSGHWVAADVIEGKPLPGDWFIGR